MHLHGDGGGEWLYHLRDGDLEVVTGGCDEASFTLIQSVDDWRGTLWEGRGGVVAERGLRLLRSGRLAALAGGPAHTADSALFERLVGLGGVLRAVITDGQAGDWAIALQFGPGEVPAEPTTTVRVAHDDIHAMSKGDLAPIQAFLAGRVSIAGDLLLAMQLQALLSELLKAGRDGP
ncbi:MAG: SCP2 sterol-binding domain-containing protein [Deltaproteobacteria bacterium]|nr:SCP2 sterol-binding domain-containing protein [Deltaproteobacteria bacterium]